MSIELEKSFNKLHNKHYSELDRQNHTTWAILDLLDLIKVITDKKDVHDKLEEIRIDLIKNG